jgi:hypothetical protein
MSGFGAAWRSGILAQLGGVLDGRRPDERAAIPLADALRALGRGDETDAGAQQVPVPQIVGSIARADDFDRAFRPRSRALRQRWESVADAPATEPVSLVRLGELYFVADGHHRVSVARRRGVPTLTARVRWICTVATAGRCLTMADLPAKTAERLFLERVPLPYDVRWGLWLDEPAGWMRLADAAESWAWRESEAGCCWDDDAHRAADWWQQEVLAVLALLRRRGIHPSDVDVDAYLRALRERDALSAPGITDDVLDRLAARYGSCC